MEREDHNSDMIEEILRREDPHTVKRGGGGKKNCRLEVNWNLQKRI